MKKKKIKDIYVEVIRTLICKYQKFMTYRLVNNIFLHIKLIHNYIYLYLLHILSINK